MSGGKISPATEFKPGAEWKGNPGGKPVGTRNSIQAAFLKALAADFGAHGAAAIVACREKDPGRYITIVASLLPKQAEQTLPLDEVTDAELVAGIALLRARLAAADGAGAIAPSDAASLN